MFYIEEYLEDKINDIPEMLPEAKAELKSVLDSYKKNKLKSYFSCLDSVSEENSEQVRFLDLGNCNCENLPTKFFQLKNLEILDISSCKNVDLSKFTAFPNLSILIAQKINLDKIPADFFKLEKLKVIDLSNNEISYLPKKISKLKSLIFFDLGGNRIRKLNNSLEALPLLTYLDAGSNRISELKVNFSKLNALVHLNLQGNLLYDLPEEIGEAPTLKYLNLMYNQIGYLPSEMKKLKLDYLNLYKNKISYHPAFLKKFKTVLTDKNKNKENDLEIFNIKLTYNTKKPFAQYFKNFERFAERNNISENHFIKEKRKSLEIVREKGKDGKSFVEALSAFIYFIEKKEKKTDELYSMYQSLKEEINAVRSAINSDEKITGKNKFINKLQNSVWEQKFKSILKENKIPPYEIFAGYAEHLLETAQLYKALTTARDYYRLKKDIESLNMIVHKLATYNEVQKKAKLGVLRKETVENTKNKIRFDLLEHIHESDEEE